MVEGGRRCGLGLFVRCPVAVAGWRAVRTVLAVRRGRIQRVVERLR
jgi:hypothetical protein